LVEKINLKLIKGINLHRVSAPERKRLEVTWSSLNVHTPVNGWKNLSRCMISKKKKLLKFVGRENREIYELMSDRKP
jgi:hypothetical protein